MTSKRPTASAATRKTTNKKKNGSTVTEEALLESLFKNSAFAGSSVAMMMVDRDFIVTYVNEATKQLLAKNADALRKIWPNFDPNEIIGACIDTFHENPAHQRQLLSDPSRLPYQTEITVGDIKFSLNVSGVFDASGVYIGNTLEWADVTADRLNSGMLDALSRSQAVIEFELDGTIVTANENFLKTLGYSLDEVKGQHHSMFVEPEYKASAEYKAFWEALGRGEFQAATYKRIGKGGKEIWIQASYNPILDASGKAFKVVKFATDVTEQEAAAGEATFKSSAFGGSSVAMMMVDRDFIVTYVNEATKKLLTEYTDAFREIWPNFDPNAIIGACIDTFHKNPAHQRQVLSDPSRLPLQTEITVGDLKFALNVSGVVDKEGDYVGNTLEWSDVTADRMNAGMLDALSRSQAVIEFELDGTIVTANENFLKPLGYSLDEVKGQHHSMFVEPEYKASAEYKAFWEALGRGEFQAATYKRIGKGGKEIWIQASYNPILDANGKAFKVVKFATDVTEAELKAQESLFKSVAFEGSSVAMMMIDRDFMVTYVNESTKSLLSTNAEAFRQIWPNFNPDTIVGSCIDIFHKNPAHQRQILSDPSRLPFQTDITVGDFKFALSVGGVFDADGNYVGNTLEWADVTADRMNQGMLAALDRSQAIIEFGLDGKIVNANDAFLSVMEYSLDEIVGKHHSMFVDPEYRRSPEYKTFWDALGRGEFQADEYQRVGKGGKEVWIQASYNPILDGNGNPFKIVKFASDISEVVFQRRKDEEGRQARAAALALVVEHLADGLNKLSQGDFSSVIEIEFEKEYEQLRGDFNAAVGTLKKADGERKERAKAQALVVESLAIGMKQLSEGNLTMRIETEFTSDYEQLRRDFNEALAKIQDVMATIVKTAGGISNGAGEISKASDDLSRRTEDQAGTLEETAAALDEITATVKQTADGANEANSVADETRGGAQKSGEVVREAVEAMGLIEDSSKQISQIIGVIGDISFQTNLLALNAGVEAARAGDAGRGFAVVAQEVRALAQRSSDAAKEIKDLISTSSQHVATGVDLVGKAGESLEEIVGRVENVSNLVSEIAASAKEQSASLSEVNTAVNKMDKVTQQNAAMVEQSTAASHSLTKDSAHLMQHISHFNIGGERRRLENDDAPQTQYNSVANTNPITEQQNRAAAFAATNGSAALQLKHENSEDDWQEF